MVLTECDDGVEVEGTWSKPLDKDDEVRMIHEFAAALMQAVEDVSNDEPDSDDTHDSDEGVWVDPDFDDSEDGDVIDEDDLSSGNGR